DHLSITCHDSDTSIVRGLCHRCNHPPQVCNSKAFLQDEACRKIEGLCSRYRQVIDRAMYGQLSDIATREEEWIDDIGIGCKCQPEIAVVKSKGSRIIHQIKQGIGESRSKNALNQIMRCFAATAMAERDMLIAQVKFLPSCLPSTFNFRQGL